jgi:hypothetical protein
MLSFPPSLLFFIAGFNSRQVISFYSKLFHHSSSAIQMPGKKTSPQNTWAMPFASTAEDDHDQASEDEGNGLGHNGSDSSRVKSSPAKRKVQALLRQLCASCYAS